MHLRTRERRQLHTSCPSVCLSACISAYPTTGSYVNFILAALIKICRAIPKSGKKMNIYIQPLKMELTQGSETSANYNLTPGKYPKEYIQYSNHGESLKSRISNEVLLLSASLNRHKSTLF